MLNSAGAACRSSTSSALTIGPNCGSQPAASTRPRRRAARLAGRMTSKSDGFDVRLMTSYAQIDVFVRHGWQRDIASTAVEVDCVMRAGLANTTMTWSIRLEAGPRHRLHHQGAAVSGEPVSPGSLTRPIT